jgi:hypothetical protein
MFKSTRSSGFKITFKNKITMSVQWGGGTYTDNRSKPFGTETESDLESSTAEIMIWDEESDRTVSFGIEEVKGWLTADDVAVIMSVCQDSSSVGEIEKKLQTLKFADFVE